MPKTELTNMVMMQDPKTGKVLVQKRIKSWCGLSFPGGHIEDSESFVDSAVREIKEETGLDIKSLEACGVIHWCHKTRNDRYMVFLYKTDKFSGELLPETDEGCVFWIALDELKKRPDLSKNFGEYIKIFTDDSINEAFGLWHEDEPDILIFK